MILCSTESKLQGQMRIFRTLSNWPLKISKNAECAWSFWVTSSSIWLLWSSRMFFFFPYVHLEFTLLQLLTTASCLPFKFFLFFIVWWYMSDFINSKSRMKTYKNTKLKSAKLLHKSDLKSCSKTSVQAACACRYSVGLLGPQWISAWTTGSVLVNVTLGVVQES